MYGPSQLLLVSKKQHIKDLVSKSESLSIEEIKNLNEKPWIIQGLIEIKEFGKNKGTGAELIANKMQKFQWKTNNIISGMIYSYHGEAKWFKTGKSELLFETGWNWIKLACDKIYTSSNIILLNEKTVDEITSSSHYIKFGDIDSLKDIERDRVSKLL